MILCTLHSWVLVLTSTLEPTVINSSKASNPQITCLYLWWTLIGFDLIVFLRYVLLSSAAPLWTNLLYLLFASQGKVLFKYNYYLGIHLLHQTLHRDFRQKIPYFFSEYRKIFIFSFLLERHCHVRYVWSCFLLTENGAL